MTAVFNPTASLNVATDASDLPGQVSGNKEVSGWMTRCKNLRLDEHGKLKTRFGTSLVSSSALDQTDVWWLDEMDGDRYSFAGTKIYKNEVATATALTSAQWSTVQYNAFNDTTKQLFAINGTDKKRITSAGVFEWGLAAPSTAPTLGIGGGAGLTGQYNAKYTYVRKVGTAIVAESNPSPAADVYQVLNNQSLSVEVTSPSDAQVTHIRLYRTQNGGSIYYLDQEIPVSTTYDYGHTYDWEDDESYIVGTLYKFTTTDSVNTREYTYTWELNFRDREDTDTDTYGSDLTPWESLPDRRNPFGEGDYYYP